MDKERIKKFSENIDTAMLLLLGFGSGSLLTGILFLFLGVFSEAGSDRIWSLNAILSGLASVGISVLVGLIAILYWKFIFLKVGSIFPQIHGLSLLLAFASAFSGSAFSTFLVYHTIM